LKRECPDAHGRRTCFCEERKSGTVLLECNLSNQPLDIKHHQEPSGMLVAVLFPSKDFFAFNAIAKDEVRHDS